MPSPYRIPSNCIKTSQNTSIDLKKHQMTSREPNPVIDSVTKTVKPVLEKRIKWR